MFLWFRKQKQGHWNIGTFHLFSKKIPYILKFLWKKIQLLLIVIALEDFIWAKDCLWQDVHVQLISNIEGLEGGKKTIFAAVPARNECWVMKSRSGTGWGKPFGALESAWKFWIQRSVPICMPPKWEHIFFKKDVYSNRKNVLKHRKLKTHYYIGIMH